MVFNTKEMQHAAGRTLFTGGVAGDAGGREYSCLLYTSSTWLLEDTGETYTPYANLHCLVLTGMGETKCRTADPLRGEQTVDKQTFLDIFAQAGSRAVVVH